MDWPFFTNNTGLVRKCLVDFDCDQVQAIVQRLGYKLFGDTSFWILIIFKKSHESCPSTRSTWLLTRTATFLLPLLFPSALTKETLVHWDVRPLFFTMIQVKGLSLLSLRVSFVTLLMWPSTQRSQPCWVKEKDSSSCWTQTLTKLKKNGLGVEIEGNDKQSFKAFIHTLSQHTAYGPGAYGMHALKSLISTDNFLQLPDGEK